MPTTSKFNPYMPFGKAIGAVNSNGSWLKSNIGGLTSAGVGGVSLVSDFINMGNEANAINTKAPQLQTDEYGNPQYNLGNFVAQTAAIKPQGATGGEVVGGLAKGASAGAAFGVPGAIIGGLVGAVGSLFGGRRRKRKMQEKRLAARRSMLNGQEDYNEAVEASAADRQASQMYMDQMNTQDRMSNLFNINPSL